MARPRQGSKKRKERDRVLAKFWSERIGAALKAQKSFRDVYSAVLGYLKPHHGTLFEDGEVGQRFCDLDGAQVVSVPKVAQLKNSLLPRLVLADPVRNVTATRTDPVSVAFSRVVQEYLNFAAREANLVTEHRRSVDDGLLAGRMVLRQGWDPIKKIIRSWHVPVLNFVFDPDYLTLDKAQWIAIRHEEPLWKTKRRVEAKWRTDAVSRWTRQGKSQADGVPATEEDDEDFDYQGGEDDSIAPTSRKVVYWEILSKMGCGLRGHGLEDVAEQFGDDEEDFVRLEVVRGCQHMLAEGKWSVPLYLDDDWPVSIKDPIDTSGTHYPESPFGQVLSCQAAADLLTTIRLSGIKNRERVLVFCDQKVQAEVQDRVKSGSTADLVPVALPPGMSLDSVVKVADFGQGSVDSARERDFLLREMETTTGVTSVVTGGQDNAPQDRSATATMTRNDASTTRVGDFKNKVEELLTDAGRKEALMVRLFLTAEEVQPAVEPTKIGMFYVRVDLPGGTPLPVRNVFEGEEEKPLTLQDFYPRAATYFESPEEALMAAMETWQAMGASTDPQVIDVRNAIMSIEAAEVDPQTGLPPSVGIDAVTVDRVWQDTAGLSAEELMRELTYKVASGTGIKFNKEAEQKNVSDLLQTLMPVMLQNMDYEGANKLLSMRDAAFDVPSEKAVRLTPPPPPPAATPGQESAE